MKNLKNLNVQEMNMSEMRKTEGGGSWWTFIGGVLASAWENVGDIRDGWNDGINNKPPRY
jgi:hypothetical protein